MKNTDKKTRLKLNNKEKLCLFNTMLLIKRSVGCGLCIIFVIILIYRAIHRVCVLVCVLILIRYSKHALNETFSMINSLPSVYEKSFFSLSTSAVAVVVGVLLAGNTV